MHKVILDTDPGIDDAMAIAYALGHPDIDLLALTTVFGNVSIEKTTRNAQYLLDCMGAEKVSVAKGAAVPLVQPPLPHSEFVHGDDGIGNCYPKAAVKLNSQAAHAKVQSQAAAEYIVSMARAAPGEITLLAVGPLTNIAQALILEPALPDLVKQLIVMGGTVDEPGNVTPLAEANFFNDPHAADTVMAADWPLTIVGLDVTHKIMLTDTHLARLRDEAGQCGQLLWDTSRFYIDFYTNNGAAIGLDEPCCAMHDAAAVVFLVEPDVFTTVSGASRVVTDGMAAGQLAMDRKGYQYATGHWINRPVTTRACMQVNTDAALNAFISTVISFGSS